MVKNASALSLTRLANGRLRGASGNHDRLYPGRLQLAHVESVLLDEAGNLWITDNSVVWRGSPVPAIATSSGKDPEALSLSFRATGGRKAVVEYTDSLVSPNWKELPSQAAELPGETTLKPAGERQRYYRVREK